MQAPIVVQKYGGSSVATPEHIKRVAQLIKNKCASGARVCVVVSAMGKTTDRLFEQAHEISPNPDRRELDMLLSSGERISMSLLAMALWDLGIPSISFTGSQSGIITNDVHYGATILEVRPIRVFEELSKNKVVIVAGYQGVSRNHEVTTLGRGGSDTTAVALAAALKAESCEIYSDVEGVFSADPRIVSNAEFIAQMDGNQVLELSSAGAKVLSQQSVQFARDNNVVIHARKTGSENLGTQIANFVAKKSAIAVAHETQLIPVIASNWSTSSALCEHLSSQGLGARYIVPVSEMQKVMCLFGADASKVIRKYTMDNKNQYDIVSPCASISIVASTHEDVSMLLLKMLEVLESIDCKIISYFSSNLRAVVLVGLDNVQHAVQVVHEKIVNLSKLSI